MVTSMAWRIAWREARASAAKFLFVIFGVAAGVGALTGVRGFSAAFSDVLRRDARTLLAADLTVRQFSEVDGTARARIEPYLQRGVRMTEITELLSMMSPGGDAPPVLVSVKAVDPQMYPFYGQLQFEPAQALASALTTGSAAVSEDLLIRLNLPVGSTVHLGGTTVRISAIVRREPDRMTGSLNVGPRVLVSRDTLATTGLLTFGSRAVTRLLFKLPPAGVDATVFRNELRKTFPDALVVDYREGHPFITRALDRSTTFLSLVSLIALVVGAIGVAMAIQSHLQQRLDSIAILKCIGARSSQIIRIYTLQTTLLGLAGGAAGVAVGALVQRLFPLLLSRYFRIEGIAWSPAFALEGIAAGMLVTLLFTVPTLLSIRRVKPALIFRREMAEVRPGWRTRVRQQVPSIAAGVVILPGLGAIAAWLAESAQLGAYFIGGLVAALLILAGFAWTLLRALRWIVARSPFRLPIAVRHGMANLYRPGNHAASVLVALGIGVMFTLTIYLVQKSLLVEVAGAAPPGAPNVFLINITEPERDALQQALEHQRFIEGKPRIQPLVPAQLVSIDNKPIDRVAARHERGRFRSVRQVGWAEQKPDGIAVRSGEWWKPGEAAALVSVSERTAEWLGVRVGSTLQWTSFGREINARVAAIHRVTSVAMGRDEEFLFNRAALAGLPAQWFATLRLPPNRVATFQRDLYRQFPTITVINGADVLTMIQEVIDQVARVVRFVSAFAILAGAIILASTIAGTRLRRARESAVLKTLGARRNRLVAIFSVEFAILGATAGLMGCLLATVFSRALLIRWFDAHFAIPWIPSLATLLLTTALALATGWLASLRVLRERPLEILRDE